MHMEKPNRTVPFSMRLDPELKARLQAMADKERRTLTNFIEVRLWDIAEADAARSKADA